ncbi:Uma2 family endonuclease [Lyngbya confervoides]|uniref:Uma2 family endonuclease n=1 Tax=Lyngbya confervoides BDU141951 TaxID=1574623 RepID=A0ABD4T0H4_9CYAN|nr:Uma2 family endonuclease [Lyngbya confervoides]MCM1982156.1 Uma2 family endonuclease [Lyngbya confervoides BDU141951]
MVKVAASTVPAQPLETDRWVKASWDEFIAIADDPAYEGGRFYFDHGRMRIEMVPLGSSHSQDDPLVARVISLFATLKGLRFKEISNGSFRKTGERGCQPDIAFYIGAEIRFPPRGDTPIDLDTIEPPSLVVEIASTTLADDLGPKRLLYERLGVAEYWVVDVNGGSITAFEIADGRSGEVRKSLVLPELPIAVVEEALRRGQREDDGVVNRWLLDLFAADV